MSDAEARRREKNREKVRRHYYRKLNYLNGLRKQVSELEETFKTLQASTNGSGGAITAVSAVTQKQQVLFKQIMDARRALELENEELRRQVFRQQAYQQQVSQIMLDEHELFMRNPRFFMITKPLTVNECEDIRAKAYDDVMAFTTGKTFFTHQEGSVMGWKDSRGVEDGFFKFVMQKTIYNHTAKQVDEFTWPVLTDPVMLAQLYSTTVRMRCNVVQRIDEDNVVIFQEYRTMDRNNDHVVMKSLFLVCRFRTSTGILVILRGLERDRLQHEDLWIPTSEEGQHEIWHDLFCWLQIDETGPFAEHCMCKFAGTAPTVGANAYFWTIEVLLLALRWESNVLGPRFQLASDDSGQCKQERLSLTEQTQQTQTLSFAL
ncbi:TPA: hypothetical protein N0F65_001077 [Lagenidium giganteum]|uniref:BZIP domain-containing protein n=1 Tax=Lagenidium giganteum TaxID=4803 RepID=A0AAV2YLM7_9STRA|nr:TPA: hypothetical protein N0F65_001077 [Lagenidium giganteum]